MISLLPELFRGNTVTATLVALSFVVPGLVLVVLEWLRGHELELRAHVWAAILLPLTAAIAGDFFRRALYPGVEPLRVVGGHHLPFAPIVISGFAASAVLFALGLPAMRAARRRRKPLVPPAPREAA